MLGRISRKYFTTRALNRNEGGEVKMSNSRIPPTMPLEINLLLGSCETMGLLAIHGISILLHVMQAVSDSDSESNLISRRKRDSDNS